MYLNLLNDEQKKCFLDYAIRLTTVDGHYSETEQEMMFAYCDEMHIHFEERANSFDIQSLVETMKNICGEREKKIILFEALGLALVDNKYHENEVKLIEYTQQQFELDDTFVEKCKVYLDEYMKLQEKINTLVVG